MLAEQWRYRLLLPVESGWDTALLHLRQDEARAPCRHHWLIESPNGNERLRGRCRRCGTERDWPAWLRPYSFSKSVRLD